MSMNQPPPPQVNIGKHTLYCMGEGYVNQRAVASEMAFAKAANRVQGDMVDRLVRAQLGTQQDQATQKQGFAQRLFTGMAKAAQRAFQVISQPFIAAGRFFAAGARLAARPFVQLAQPAIAAAQAFVSQASGALNTIASAIASFFFGPEKKESKTEDKSKRDAEDLPFKITEEDLFNLRKVSDSNGASLGGGGQ